MATPRHAGSGGQFRFELSRPQDLADAIFRDCRLGIFLADDVGGDRSRDGPDRPFQIAHAGFAGVAFDNPVQGIGRESHLLGCQTAGFKLAWHQVALRDVHLVGFCVPRDFDHFQAIAEGGRHGIHRVGRGNEQHIGQIKRYIQVVVRESMVLCRVQYLKQCRSRVAAEVGAELVDLVEHHHRVAAACLSDFGDNSAGHGADICAAMAANVGFIANTAQGNADELAADRFGDALAKAGFANARGGRQSRGSLRRRQA